MINMAFMPLYMWEMWDVTPVTHGRTHERTVGKYCSIQFDLNPQYKTQLQSYVLRLSTQHRQSAWGPNCCQLFAPGSLADSIFHSESIKKILRILLVANLTLPLACPCHSRWLCLEVQIQFYYSLHNVSEIRLNSHCLKIIGWAGSLIHNGKKWQSHATITKIKSKIETISEIPSCKIKIEICHQLIWEWASFKARRRWVTNLPFIQQHLS